MRRDLEIAHIKRIANMIKADYPDDGDLLADMLEGETDLHRLASRIVEGIEHEDGESAALKSQIDNRQARKKSSGKRKDALRSMLIQLLDAAQSDGLKLPEVTISLRKIAAKRIVLDADAVPDKYTKLERKVDMSAFDGVDGHVAGTTMDNGGQSGRHSEGEIMFTDEQIAILDGPLNSAKRRRGFVLSRLMVCYPRGQPHIRL
jgi:hypothetical protein